MARSISQVRRTAVLDTPFGPDALGLTRFDGSEGLSELFEYRVEAVSETPNLDFNTALGQNCSITINTYNEKKRLFNGTLVEAQWIGQRNDLHVYRLVLRPWLWLLSQTSDCRIFHNQSPVDIILSVFREAGFTDFRDATNESYDPIPYCVQYRESKLAFVSRLMEEFGIYYYFDHSAAKHDLVLADVKASHASIEGGDTFPYMPNENRSQRKEEHILTWMTERRFRTGKVTFRDYDFERPNADLTAEASSSGGYQKSDLEVFDYPGRYTQTDKGQKLAKVRLQSKQALDKRRYATGDCPRLVPGGLFTLSKYGEEGENREYLVIRATHSFTTENFRSTKSVVESQPYRGNFEVLASDIPFKAPAVTSKPLVFGPQTAKVVGKDGEEIDVDKYGRILVRFHWDRKNDASCRVRLGQVWSGKGWGGIFIPRIGQEVIVEFLEGDPDQPLVVGTVYNGLNTVPYKLPDNHTVSGWKSDTSKGGGGHNELKFDDKKDEQLVEFRAEKDLKSLIRNQEKRDVGENRTTGGDDTRETIIRKGNDKRIVTDKDDILKVEKGNQDINVAGTINVFAGQKITLTCGQNGSVIEMTPFSIKIKAPMMVTVEAQMIKVEAEMQATVKGGIMMKTEGGAFNVVKGGLVLINSGG